jgi:hypothetical protein
MEQNPQHLSNTTREACFQVKARKGMVNKDYVLRLAERFGRMLAIIMGLRKYNKHEEALLAIDDYFLQTLGLTTGFINSASEEMLLSMISPLGVLNVEKALWLAVLLKEEGDIYLELDKPDESYYRYIKSLFFFTEAALRSNDVKDLDLATPIDDILKKLADFELPLPLKNKLFRYFELTGRYAQAENMLFEITEGEKPVEGEILEQGKAFYERLLKKSETDLKAGGLTREEVEEGLERW